MSIEEKIKQAIEAWDYVEAYIHGSVYEKYSNLQEIIREEILRIGTKKLKALK